jgi:hypothetical protein
MTFVVPYRAPRSPRPIPADEYRRAQWYGMGATSEPFPAAYRGASQDGTECRMAYNAGVIARLFGVDLRMTLNLSE